MPNAIQNLVIKARAKYQEPPKIKDVAVQVQTWRARGKKMETHCTSFGAGAIHNIRTESGEERDFQEMRFPWFF